MAWLLVAVAACGGDASAPTSAPTTTAVPVTSTTGPVATTTTLSRLVEAPATVDSFRYVIEVGALVREPGLTDIDFEVTVEGNIVGDREQYSVLTRYGVTVFEEQFVLIGDEAWIKEGRKPWRVYDPVLEGELDEPSAASVLGDYDDLYDGLSELDWLIETIDGRRARRYALPTDRRLRLIDWLPNDLFAVVTSADDLAIDVWIDAATNDLLRVAMDMKGGPDLLATEGFDPDEFADGTDVTMTVKLEFSEHGSDRIVVREPLLVVADGVPEGFFVYEEPDFGYRLLLPLDWELLPSESYPGFDIPLLTLPPFDVPEDVVLTLSVEDLRSEPGLRAEDYALIHVEVYAGRADYEIRISERTDVDGIPGWRVVADVAEADAPYTLESVVVLVGTDGYALDYVGYDGWYAETEDVRNLIFESFEFWEPEAGST